MAGYLLDTHIVYWWMTGDKRLRKSMRKLIAEEACAVSVLSIWEMVLKNARGKLPLLLGPIDESLENQGFRLMPIHARHVEASRRLSTSHADPFDRLLLATAQVEHLIVLTCDEALIALRQDRTLPLSPA